MFIDDRVIYHITGYEMSFLIEIFTIYCDYIKTKQCKSNIR